MQFIRALTPRQLENVHKYKRKKPAMSASVEKPIVRICGIDEASDC
jgi:hypothetical protein